MCHPQISTALKYSLHCGSTEISGICSVFSKKQGIIIAVFVNIKRVTTEMDILIMMVRDNLACVGSVYLVVGFWD